MILSLLDNDLYKFTMQQAVHMLYPRAVAEYRFVNRGQTAFPAGFDRALKAAVEGMAALSLSGDEVDYLSETCPFFTPVYLDFLTRFRFDPGEITITQDAGALDLRIRGPWFRTILWEIPLMALISEIYFDLTRPPVLSESQIRARNRQKTQRFRDNGVIFVDFGTRRRFSARNHQNLIRDILATPDHTLAGTSNLHLAKENGIRPIGTMAHEWIMFHAILAGYPMANTAAMDAWVRVFNGSLGIGLTDTFTTPLFLPGFDSLRARIFDGVRQDSGNPVRFLETIIAHYQGLGIDPATKTVVFSDGLDTDRAVAIHRQCNGRIRDVYGIGTSLTNDVGASPLNMVIKMTRAALSSDRPWQSTVKLSDNRKKHTGDPDAIRNCLQALGL